LEALPEFRTPGPRRNMRTWARSLKTALALADSELPLASPQTDAPPPPRSWAQRDPAAWGRLEAARRAVSELSEQRNIPGENLLKPDYLRRLCWTPPTVLDAASIRSQLAAMGARPWQIDAVTPALAACWQAPMNTQAAADAQVANEPQPPTDTGPTPDISED